MLCSKAQFISLAQQIPRGRPRSTQTSDRLAAACFDPFTMRLLKFSNIIETAKLTQREKIDNAIAFRWLLDRQIPVVRPLCGMLYHTGAHLVEVNVHDATM
jgi:hypothetical protein